MWSTTILVSFPSIHQCGWQHSRYQVDVPKNVPTDYTLVHLCKTKFTMTTLLIQHIPHLHQHSMPSTCFHWSHIPLQPLQLHHHVRTTKSQVHSFDGCLHPPITHCLNDTHATKSLIIPSLGFVLWEVYDIGPIPHILFELKCLHHCWIPAYPLSIFFLATSPHFPHSMTRESPLNTWHNVRVESLVKVVSLNKIVLWQERRGCMEGLQWPSHLFHR